MQPAVTQHPASSPEGDKTGIFERLLRMVRDSLDHASSLAELFRLELGEYGRRTMRRYCLLALAGMVLTLAYLALWATLIVFLGPEWGYGWCCAGVCIFHALAGVILLLAGLATRPGALAPLTTEELKTDYECLRMSLQENAKSSRA